MRSIFILAISILLYSCQGAKEEAAEVKDEIKQETQELQDDVADLAAEINPPDAPAKSFASDYPDVKNPDWEKEGDKYEVSFTKDGKEITAIYNADGSRYATETEISAAELPAAVQKAASTYGTLTEASKVVMAGGGSVQYEAEAGDKDYTFDEKGNLLATETGDDDDDD